MKYSFAHLQSQLRPYRDVIVFVVTLLVANYFWKWTMNGDEYGEQVTWFGLDVTALFEISYHGDRITAAIFGGILSGTGLGLIFLRGGSTGGTDIIARNLNKRFPFISIGSIVLISDAVVVVLSAIVYGKLENALYAVIAIFTSSKLIDAVVFGFSRDNGKLLIIITSAYEAVTDTITSKEDKGVTLIKAAGGYSKADLGVILCAVHPRDAYRIKGAVLSVDDHAFIITTTATAVSGLGFTNFS